LDKIKAGMTDAQADAEVAAREAARNHAGTGFVRVRGRQGSLTADAQLTPAQRHSFLREFVSLATIVVL